MAFSIGLTLFREVRFKHADAEHGASGKGSTIFPSVRLDSKCRWAAGFLPACKRTRHWRTTPPRRAEKPVSQASGRRFLFAGALGAPCRCRGALAGATE